MGMEWRSSSGTYTCINRFPRNNFFVAMGPAGFLASFYKVFNAFFFSSPQTQLPSLTGVVYPGLLAWEGVVALSRKREEKCEKGAAADPWCGMR